jgi:Ribbon-helix-helix protein, copG family
MGVAIVTRLSYPAVMAVMKGITIKLPERTLRRLKQEARATGRSVAALVRDRVEALPDGDGRSVFAVTSDLAGSLAGGRKAATNERRKFGRA